MLNKWELIELCWKGDGGGESARIYRKAAKAKDFQRGGTLRLFNKSCTTLERDLKKREEKTA